MYDEDLAMRVRAAMGDVPVVEVKMFGGLACMVNGNMTVGVMKDALMVRTGPEMHASALGMPGARPMDFTGRPMKGFVLVDTAVLDDETLAYWVEMGVAYGSSLPAKGASKPSRPRPLRRRTTRQ